MIVVGDLSGIQTYLFDVSDAGGGQARRLRARSFFLQVIPDLAAIRITREFGWGFESLRMAGAGKFLLEGPAPSDAHARLQRLDAELNTALFAEACGELRLSLGWSDDSGSETDQYRQGRDMLQQAKARPWAPLAAPGEGWNPASLVLPPLDTPCALCGHRRAEEEELDEAGEVVPVCRRCKSDGEVGRSLPRGRWLLIRDDSADGPTCTFGLRWEITSDDIASVDSSVVAVANLRQPDQSPPDLPARRFWKRPLMCHIPTDGEGAPVWFEHLAKQSRGDSLLGVLKADADSVGAALEETIQGSPTIKPLTFFSQQLDDFFARRLKSELDSNAAWQPIYTVFGGGDDLLLVGPWDVMVDFAGRLNELFQLSLKRRGLALTLSAGLALTKWKRPIKFAAAQAEELLEQAKRATASGEATAKDQVAAFGQVWKWKHHAVIVGEGKQLARWVDDGVMPRGWLHTLLELATARIGETARNPDPLATARLAHHVARNYRQGSEIRRWGDELGNDFDSRERVETRYLPAIVRYALTATRNPSKED
jgi:CRISPR-associated protein Csm1